MARSIAARSVLVLSLVFPPDGVSTAQLFGELVEDLVAQGRRVIVVTTTPHYSPPPTWTSTRRWWGLVQETTFRGATVYHAAMPRKHRSVVARILAWLAFHVMSVVIAWRFAGPVDVVLSPSPPLTIGLAAWVIAATKRARYIYNVQELYPDAALALGMIKDGALLSLLRVLERHVYDRAFAVTVIANGMRERIIARGTPAAKVRLIPNFVDTGDIIPRPKRNAFSDAHGLSDRFVVMYAGNLGRAQGLDTVVRAASRIRERPEIVFAFIGEGTETVSMQRLAAELQATNCRFIPQQPYERMPDIYGTSDLCLVPLLSGLAYDAVPSKVYRIMAAGRPVLAITALDSDLARVVRTAGAGLVVAPGDPDALADAVLAAALDPIDVSGSRAWVTHHVERHLVTAQYGALLDEAASS